jgi:hypothetical protein
LGFAAWITVTNWESIKKFNKIDYTIIGVALVLIAAVVATYLYGSQEYIAGISNTIYPGARQDSGGSLDVLNTINKMMNGGVYSPISSRRGFIYTNICEFGGMYTVFPLPILFVSFMMIRKRFFDLLSIILIAYTVIIGSYILVGWPEWLSRVTLMSNTVSIRAMDVVLFAQVFLLIRAMSLFKAEPGIEGLVKKSTKIETVITVSSVAVALLLTYIAIGFSTVTFTTPLGSPFFIFTYLGFLAVVYSLFDCQRRQDVFRVACLYMVIISTSTLMMVHPIMRGLDAIYSKPLSAKVQELALDTDEKWLSTEGIVGSSFLIANGASTISSTNIYPNLDLWHMLDPDRLYEYAYNRYAVVTVSLTSEQTSFELLHLDHFHINFSYNDLEAAGVKYIHTGRLLFDREGISFTLQYNEGGSRIYLVEYS